MNASMPPIDNAVRFRLAGKSNPLILVPVVVDESGPYEFLLDSGATRSMLARDLATKLGIEQHSLDTAVGAGGSCKLGFVPIKSLRVGPAAQGDLTLGIADDLAAIGNALKVEVAGLLGFDFIKNSHLTINYQQQIILFPSSLQNAGSHLSSSRAVEFDLGPTEPLMLVATHVNGRGPFQFVIDTAAGKTVIAPALLEQIGKVVENRHAAMGFGGSFELAGATLECIRVSDISVRSLPAVTGSFLDAIEASLGAKVDGIIGNDFLRKFSEVTICGPERRIVFGEPLPAI